MFDVAMFYVNRVRSENKGDNNHAEWAKSWCDVFSALQGYIKQWHTTGLSWNSAPVCFIYFLLIRNLNFRVQNLLVLLKKVVEVQSVVLHLLHHRHLLVKV
jgi:hypothetical protein